MGNFSIHDKIWYLSRCRIFQNLTKEEIENLTKTDMFTVKRGEKITWTDREDPLVYVVKKGGVKIISKQPGSSRETILAILGHGELFGQMPHFGANAVETQAIALEDTTICEFLASDIESAMENHPETRQSIAKMYGQRLSRIEKRVSHLLFKHSRQRVSTIILDLLEDWSEPHPETHGKLVAIRVTHQDIANLAGLTRETVSVTLADFELNELITTRGRKIIVIDEELLKKVQNGTYIAPEIV